MTKENFPLPVQQQQRDNSGVVSVSEMFLGKMLREIQHCKGSEKL
jgi:hypothetical protein